MRVAISAILFVFAAACSQVDPISDEEEVEIDCLASQTVVAITDAIRLGINEGLNADALDAIPDKEIEKAITRLEAKYSGRMDTAFLEYDINHRLQKIEVALNDPETDPEATAIMTETLELGRTCTFGGQP